MKSIFVVIAALAALLIGAAPAHAANSADAKAAVERHRAEQRGGARTDDAAAPVPEPVRAPAAMKARNGGWAVQLASCKAAAGMNPIKREKCVWSHCNGHWGEGDCPPGSDWPPKFEKPKFEKFGTTPANANR